jgi:hypothetical protein
MIREMIISLRNTSYGKEYQLRLSQEQAEKIKEKYESNYEKIVRDIKLEKDELSLIVHFFSQFTKTSRDLRNLLILKYRLQTMFQ